MLSIQTKNNLSIFNPSNPRNFNSGMWKILVEWMYDVVNQFQIQDSVLVNAIILLSQLFHNNKLNSSNIQLYATVCMSISSNIIERFAPEIDDWLYVMDGGFDKRQFLDACADVIIHCNGILRQLSACDILKQQTFDGLDLEYARNIH